MSWNDYLYIGYIVGFVTAGWILPFIGRLIDKRRKVDGDEL